MAATRLLLGGSAQFQGGRIFRGPLPSGYEIVPLNGRTVRGASVGDSEYLLDLRVVATIGGEHQLRSVDVTYRAGFLRNRTVRLSVPGCVTASSDWTSQKNAPFPIP